MFGPVHCRFQLFTQINFKPVARIYAGFLCASFAMVRYWRCLKGFVSRALTLFPFLFRIQIYSAVLQYYIYKASPCRHHGRQNDYPDGECPSVLSISVWVQVPAYFLIGVSECFASVAGLEYAYNKAPASMKSFVQAIYLLTTAVANALNFALVPVSRDPYLIGNYAGELSKFGRLQAIIHCIPNPYSLLATLLCPSDCRLGRNC